MSENPRQEWLERKLEGLYSLSLRALPEPIRRRWAADMQGMFAERLRDAAQRGGIPIIMAVGTRELGSITLAALRSRVGQATGRVHRAHDAQDGSDVWRTDPVPALFPREDRRPLKLAMAGALASHFVLFMIVFPGSGTTEVVRVPGPDRVELKTWKPWPPPERERIPAIIKTPGIPLPAPRPRAPEPRYDSASTYIDTLPDLAVADFHVRPPATVPARMPERVRAGADVRPPRRIEYVKPAYPEQALRARIECTVVLEAVVGRTGTVGEVEVLRRCGRGLDESATAAVRQWRYTPTTLNGRPVEVISVVTVRFVLRQQ